MLGGVLRGHWQGLLAFLKMRLCALKLYLRRVAAAPGSWGAAWEGAHLAVGDTAPSLPVLGGLVPVGA